MRNKERRELHNSVADGLYYVQVLGQHVFPRDAQSELETRLEEDGMPISIFIEPMLPRRVTKLSYGIPQLFQN
jgi:hypothetical protein